VTKTEIKHKAQKHIMEAVQCSFDMMVSTHGGTFGTYTQDEIEAINAEMDEQMKRIEKLFGYVPGSWQRGV
jgi:restriction endonuclease